MVTEDPERLYEIFSVDDILHVVPVDDIFNHIPVFSCPCCPFQQAANERDIRLGHDTKEVWIHKRIKDDENKH